MFSLLPDARPIISLTLSMWTVLSSARVSTLICQGNLPFHAFLSRFKPASDFAVKIPVTVHAEKSARNNRSPFFAFECGPYCPPEGHLIKQFHWLENVANIITCKMYKIQANKILTQTVLFPDILL